MRRLSIAPVLIALAVRPRQVPERLAAALERAHRAAELMRVELGALTPVEARELVGEKVDALFAESGGNPFYLEQLARSLNRTRDGAPAVPERLPTDLEVPHAVAAALA